MQPQITMPAGKRVSSAAFTGTADPLPAVTVAAPPGRSRCSTRCRDRNGCKSALERDSAGTRTTGRADRGRPRHRSYHPPPAWRPAVDALPLRCDNAPAFVPLHGVGHGADANCQVRVGAVPAFQCWRRFIAPTDALSAAGVRKHAISRGIGRNRCHRRPRTRHHAGHRNCRRPRSFSKPHHRIAQVGPQGASRPSASLRAMGALRYGGGALLMDYAGQSSTWVRQSESVDMPPEKCGSSPPFTMCSTSTA